MSARRIHWLQDLKNISLTARVGIKYGFSHPVILWLVIATILAMTAFQPLNMYWSPRLNHLSGNQIWLMGWVWAGISLFMMFGGILAKKFTQIGKSYLWILIFTALILAIPIIIASMSELFSIVLSGFLIYEIGRGMIRPIQKSYLNKHIRPENRATVLSFESMMGKIGAAIGLVGLGWIAKNYSIQYSWLISAILLLFLIPIYIKVTENEKNL